MSIRTIAAFAAVLTCLLSSAPARAESPENALSLKTEKVIVFKDGYCLVIKRGRAVTNEDGEIFTEQVPDAASRYRVGLVARTRAPCVSR